MRIRRGITLESIAAVTNVPVPLWEAFEDNDLYGWPSGVLARSFVSEYARLIGEDADEVVNEFCRLFPQGDRRRARIVSEYADLVGQQMVWSDEPPRREERRAPLRRAQAQRLASSRERLASALVDVVVIAAGAATGSAVLGAAYPTSLVTAAAAYYAACAMSRRSPGAYLVKLATAGGSGTPRRLRSESHRSPAR